MSATKTAPSIYDIPFDYKIDISFHDNPEFEGLHWSDTASHLECLFDFLRWTLESIEARATLLNN